jgi:hypothetical protein
MKKLMFAFLLASVPFIASAQFWEGGVYGGVGYYGGDMATRAIEYNTLQPTVGGFLRYNPSDPLSLRLSTGWGRVAHDMANTSPNFQHYEAFLDHNLSFRTDIVEVSGIVEWNILGFDPYNLRKTFTPYLFAGLTGFYFNPKAEYQGEWIALQPLGTEGQGMEGYQDRYSRVAFAIPFGLGVKFSINDLWNIGLDWGSRFTFTDYIDDASSAYVSRTELLAGNGEVAANLANRMGEYRGTEPVIVPTGTPRGNSSSNDVYTYLTITASYNFMDNGLVGFRRRNRRTSSCPTNF